MTEATKEEAHAHNKEQVGQDRAEHGGLDDFDLAILESDNADLGLVSFLAYSPLPEETWGVAYNQLDSVAKGGVQQASQCFSELQ